MDEQETQPPKAPGTSLEESIWDGTELLPQFAIVLRNFINNNSVSSVSGRSYISTQTISTTFNTKVVFDNNDFANGITWDGTNFRFTCLTAGKYLVSSVLQWSSPATNFSYTLKLYKNNSVISQSSFIPGNFAGFASNVLSDIVTLAKNDYLEIFVFQASGVNQTINGGTQGSFFAITKI